MRALLIYIEFHEFAFIAKCVSSYRFYHVFKITFRYMHLMDLNEDRFV